LKKVLIRTKGVMETKRQNAGIGKVEAAHLGREPQVHFGRGEGRRID